MNKNETSRHTHIKQSQSQRLSYTRYNERIQEQIILIIENAGSLNAIRRQWWASFF